MKSLTPFNLTQWIDSHRHELQPPVCNQQIFEEDDFIVMVVGGPNSRSDYHVDEGPELFYQIEGSMVLRIVDAGERREITIAEGDMLLLPPRVPHSPQRFANTVGLVVERKRLPHELDGFVWYCENCDHKLYEESVHVADIVSQLPEIFERFFGSTDNRRCEECGAVMPTPDVP